MNQYVKSVEAALRATAPFVAAWFGFTMIAVKLKDHASLGPVMARVAAKGMGIKLARWDEASGFSKLNLNSKGTPVRLALGLLFKSTRMSTPKWFASR